MRALGLSPDLVILRSDHKLDDSVRAKVASFCHVASTGNAV